MAKQTLERLLARRRAIMEASANANRWGDTRRFMGRAAGNRMDKLRKIDAQIDKVIEASKTNANKKPKLLF